MINVDTCSRSQIIRQREKFCVGDFLHHPHWLISSSLLDSCSLFLFSIFFQHSLHSQKWSNFNGCLEVDCLLSRSSSFLFSLLKDNHPMCFLFTVDFERSEKSNFTERKLPPKFVQSFRFFTMVQSFRFFSFFTLSTTFVSWVHQTKWCSSCHVSWLSVLSVSPVSSLVWWTRNNPRWES